MIGHAASFNSPALQVIVGFGLIFLTTRLLLCGAVARRHLDANLRGGFYLLALLYTAYLSTSTVYTLNNDTDGHLSYLRALYFWHMPAMSEGWSTYHPPLYYLLAQPFLRLGVLLDAVNPLLMVRVFSTCLALTFSLYGIALCGLLVRARRSHYLCALLITLWPVCVGQSGKVNNDVLLQTLIIAGCYYLLWWQATGALRHLWRAIALGCLSVAVKSTGFVFCGVVALVFLRQYFKKRVSLKAVFAQRRVLLAVCALALLCLGLNVGRTVAYRIRHHAPMNFIVGNMTNSHHPNRIYFDGLHNFISFEFGTMLRLRDTPKNAVFWNYATRTFLLGEHWWGFLPAVRTTIALYLLLLAYTALGLGWRVSHPQPVSAIWFTPLLLSFSSLLALLYLRVSIPAGSSGDARYIFYTMPFLVACFARTTEWHREQGRAQLCSLGYILAGLFVGSSAELLATSMWRHFP